MEWLIPLEYLLVSCRGWFEPCLHWYCQTSVFCVVTVAALYPDLYSATQVPLTQTDLTFYKPSDQAVPKDRSAFSSHFSREDSEVTGHLHKYKEMKYEIQESHFKLPLIAFSFFARSVNTSVPPQCLRTHGVSTCLVLRGVRSCKLQRRVKPSLQTIILIVSFTPPSSTCSRTTWAPMA